jgi:hypothetical protein
MPRWWRRSREVGPRRDAFGGPRARTPSADYVAVHGWIVALSESDMSTVHVAQPGPEFRSQASDAWAYERKVVLDFIQPGKPIQNAVLESYNGRMRDDLLNLHWWRTIDEARTRSEGC